MKFLSDILAKAGLVVDGVVTLNSVANATTDTDKFIVVDSGVVKYRTGAQLLSDIGGQVAGSYVPTSRTLTINGVVYDLSADRTWTITAGVSSVSAGSGISVNQTTGAITVTNTGLLSATAGSGISVSTVSQNLNIVNTGLLSATAGTGISVSTVSQNLNIVNTGLLSATAGVGISVSTTSQNVNIVNTGILSATAGVGISVSVVSGNLNIVNTITDNNQLANGAGYATTSYVTTQINNLVAGAPGLLDTLDELAAALGDDPNFATTITTALSNRLRVDTATQGLTSTQQSNGRTNLGLGSLATLSSIGNSYITDLAWSKITGAPNFLTAEADTLSTVVARGNTTSTYISVDYIITTNNGNGTNVRIGDDLWMGDVNLANTVRFMGVQNNANAYIIFGNGDSTALGRAGTGALTYGGNTVYHSGNLTNLNQLTNGPGYITSSGSITGSAGSLSNNSDYFVARAAGAGTNIDTFTDNGWRALSYTGYSSQLWSVNSGGSTGTVQFELEYNTPVRGFKVRNKTDNNSWSSTGWVVMTTSNQGHISGTIATQSWVTSQGYVTGGPYMLTTGIPSGSDQYVNFRVIRNSAAGSSAGLFLGYGNQNGGDTLLFGGGSTNSTLTIGSSSITLNGTISQSTSSTQPVVIYGDSGGINGLFRIQVDEVNDSFGSGARTYLGDGGIDLFIGTGNSSYTPSNSYIALNHSGEISMGAGSATKHLVINTSGFVGINLTNPQAILDVSHTAGTTNIIRVSNGAGNYRWRVDQFFNMYMTNSAGVDTFGVTTAGVLTATSLIKSGGTSSQFLMADGSVSTNPGWITSYTETDTLATVVSRGSLTYNTINVAETTGGGFMFRTNSSWGGWARHGFSIGDGSGNVLASLGGYGGAGTSISYMYIGKSYLDYSASFDPDGNVELRHNNTTRLVADSLGVSITGRLAGGSWASFTSSTQGTPILTVNQEDTSTGYYLFEGRTGGSEVFRIERTGSVNVNSGSSYLRVSGIVNGSYIELSGNLPGYSNGQYPVLKSGGTIHFANNNKYSAFLEGANTYFGIMNSSQVTRVFLNTSGSSYLTGGGLGIGTSSPDANLDSRISTTWASGNIIAVNGTNTTTITNNSSLGTVAISALGAGLTMTFSGNATIGNSGRSGAVDAIFTVGNTSAGTITVSQASTIRAMAGGSFATYYNPGSATTVTHLAGIRILPDINTGAGTVTITNKYGLLIGDASGGSGSITYTTRWGIYQEGASDNNYFAAKVMIGTTTIPTETFYVNGTSYFNGNMTVNGTITELSTIRIKNNVETLEGSLEKLDKLRGVSYNRTDNNRKEIGLIAEEVEQVYPEFVAYDNDGNAVGLHYARLTAVLLQSIKELNQKINNLENRN